MGHIANFKITDNMCAFLRKIKATGMLDILQSVAGEHAQNLGIGYEDLKEKGYAFVLARIKYDLYESIDHYDEIYVETTPLVPGRIDFDRDFEIYNKDKKLIGIATSKWVIIDLNTRRICRSSVFSYPCEVREKGNYESFDKLTFDKEGLSLSYQYVVRDNDIDFLSHMNNTRYADALKYKGVCKHFEINFINEVVLHDELVIYHDDNHFIGYHDDTVSFKAYVEYF